MSWWDTSGLTNFASQASQALKNAQKKIDKVLDIDEGDASGQTSQQSKPTEEASTSWSTDSWNSWSMSWDTLQDKSSTEKTSNVKQEKLKSERSKTSRLKQDEASKNESSLKSTQLTSSDSVKVKELTHSGETQSQNLEKQIENLSVKEEITKPKSLSVEISDNRNQSKMAIHTESETDQSADSYVETHDTSVDMKSITDTESSSSGNILTGSIKGNADRLSPLSVGSGETMSTDSQSYEKIQNPEKSNEDVISLHSASSNNEITDSSVNVASKISDLMTKSDSSPSNEKSEDSEETDVIEMLSTSSVVIGEDSSVQDKAVILTEMTPSDCPQTQQFDSVCESSNFIESHFTQPDIVKSSEIIVSNTERSDSSDISTPYNTESKDIKSEDEGIIDQNLGTSDNSVDPEENLSIDFPQSSTNYITTEDSVLSETENEVPVSDNVTTETIEGITEDTSNASALSPVGHHVRNSSLESHDDQPSSPLATSSSGEGSKLDSSVDTDDTVVGYSAKADNDSIGSVSPSSSYVKCMIEEAMDDNMKMEDNSSDGHSVGKSECSRSTGGHESGDEVDTTTSSDIEIISTPTSNGENNKFIDLSPLKIALQKTARRNDGSHRRNDSHDSQSSSSSHSRGEQMSPGRDTDSSEDGVEMKITSEEAKAPLCRELPPLDEEVADPYNTQKLLKKLAEMAEVLQAREDKLIVLSKENMDLVETNNILRNQLHQVEETRTVEMEDVEQVTHEFTKRLSESERLCQQAIREKEAIKKQFEEMQADFQKKLIKQENFFKEKEQIVTELMQEGEKLSKQQLQGNTIIKKLRAKEKETDSLVTGYRKKIDDQTTEIEHLKTCLDSKEEMEKKQTEAINQLNTAVQKQERELTKLRSIESDAGERVRGLQAALDNSYKEIAELNKSKAALDNQAQAAALSQGMQIREELKATLEREQVNFKQERETLIIQIEDLRLSMQRMEKEHNRREDMLRQEISDLQVQLQEDEARNQDLSQNVTSATRPLLRQIENLQSTFAQQSASWEKVEKNLSDRLYEAQTQLAMMTERERSASEKLMDINTQVATLESQNSHLRQDKSQLNAQQEILKSKVQVLEDAKNSEAAQLEAFRQHASRDMAEIRKEKVFLETQLDMEKTKCEQEKKKFYLAQEQITQLERDLQRPQSRSSTHSPVSISRAESVSSMTETPNVMLTSFTEDDIDKHFILGTPKTSLYDSLRQSGAANLLENLQSQLKLREGEIAQLQSDIQQLERTRESMARELVNLTNQNEALEEKVQELPHLQDQFKELNQRYNAILQMYGEKVEEADELRLDLNDVKEMYKMQIDHLLAK
ncbi:TATA element modulatory factor-like isoform X2 [Mytilus californianus]|uniref:TATA element modulatory factor-like isoform X2 n=1 Tax=Mytilus californianus TaxID=6549 RepID=UPI00224506D5|nr:TATA element modulatory factor-like isoform X2 [Mytilus californianus]